MTLHSFHTAAIEHINRQRTAATPAHAFLLIGPTGSGKRLVAHSFIDTLLKGQRDALFEYTEAPKIDDIRHLRRRLMIARSGHRLVILHRFAHGSAQAQNALLKTLEDPGAQTTFLLLTESLNTVLPTIQSRATVVRLAPTQAHEQIPDEIADQLHTMITAPLHERFALAKHLGALDPDELQGIVSSWLILLEALLRYNDTDTITDRFRAQFGQPDIAPAQLARGMQQLIQLRQPQQNAQLIFEQFAINSCKVSE